MSVYGSQFPEVLRAVEAGHFEDDAIEWVRAPVDSPREDAALATLTRRLASLLDKEAPSILGVEGRRLSEFGVWLLDLLWDHHGLARYA